MTEKPYHHGDLRNTIIEAGIELINKNGIHQFSLRKVAVLCGVSHNALYGHFKDIDALIKAMSEHVAAQLTKVLQSAIECQEKYNDVIMKLGKSYISAICIVS